MIEPARSEHANGAKNRIGAPGPVSRSVLILSAVCALAHILAVAAPAYSAFRDFCDLGPVLFFLGLCCLIFTALHFRSLRYGAIPGALVLASGWSVAPEALRLARELTMQAPNAAARPVKVLTANLWSYNFRFDKFLNLVAEEAPDVLIVQEANGPWSLALRSLAPEYKFVSGCTAPSQCNVAILSRFDEAPNTSVWTSAFGAVELALPERWGGGRISVIGAHVSRSPRQQKQNDIAALGQLASARRHRLIMAGDFNATPWSGRLRPLDDLAFARRRTIGLPTWPTPSFRFPRRGVGRMFAIFPIDHVYAGNEFATVSTRRLPDIGSDHYPVLTTLVLKNAAETLGREVAHNKP